MLGMASLDIKLQTRTTHSFTRAQSKVKTAIMKLKGENSFGSNFSFVTNVSFTLELATKDITIQSNAHDINTFVTLGVCETYSYWNLQATGTKDEQEVAHQA